MSFRFTDRLYATRRDMLDDIAETWLSAGGSNSADLQADLLADLTDEQFAVECVAGFSLDGRPPVDPWSEDAPENHMESHGYSQADLAAAFGRARARVAERLADSQDEDEAFDDAQRTPALPPIGARVEAGDTEEDHDTGRVVATEGDQVTVAWDSGTRTTQHFSLLRRKSSQ